MVCLCAVLGEGSCWMDGYGVQRMHQHNTAPHCFIGDAIMQSGCSIHDFVARSHAGKSSCRMRIAGDMLVDC